MEARDGTVVGVEVKSSATVRSGDFAGLRVLEEIAGHRFRRNVVLYTGTDVVSFGPRVSRCTHVAALVVTARQTPALPGHCGGKLGRPAVCMRLQPYTTIHNTEHNPKMITKTQTVDPG
jgi:hypothetical protein